MAGDVRETSPEAVSGFSGRGWLFPRLVEWLEESDKRTLLLTGDPGTGKSTVAGLLAGLIPEPRDETVRAGARRLRAAVKGAHFCQASSRNISPKAFAENIANQFTATLDGFADALAASLADRVQITATQTIGQVAPGGTVTGISIGRIDLGTLGDELSFDRAFTDPLKKLDKTRTLPETLIVVRTASLPRSGGDKDVFVHISAVIWTAGIIWTAGLPITG